MLIQPDDRNQRKTDRRDAASLNELLWVNRERLLQGKPVRGLRQVDIANTRDQENRRLTTLRKQASQTRTRLINQIRSLLRKHNLEWIAMLVRNKQLDWLVCCLNIFTASGPPRPTRFAHY